METVQAAGLHVDGRWGGVVVTPWQMFWSGVTVGAVAVGLFAFGWAVVLGIRERRATSQPPEVVRARGLRSVKWER